MSTEVTTEMMNRAICEFMGWEFKPDGEDWFKAYHDGDLMWAAGGKELNKILLEGFKFHEDWNKLMQVVEMLKDKLYGLWNDNQIQERPQMEISLNTNTIKLVDVETGWCLIDPISKDTLKETVYHACYEIIKWYNQQKQTNDERGTNKG